MYSSIPFLNWGLVGDKLPYLLSASVVHGKTNSTTWTGRQVDLGFGLSLWRREKSIAITENRTIAPRFSSP